MVNHDGQLTTMKRIVSSTIKKDAKQLQSVFFVMKYFIR